MYVRVCGMYKTITQCILGELNVLVTSFKGWVVDSHAVAVAVGRGAVGDVIFRIEHSVSAFVPVHGTRDKEQQGDGADDGSGDGAAIRPTAVVTVVVGCSFRTVLVIGCFRAALVTGCVLVIIFFAILHNEWHGWRHIRRNTAGYSGVG